MEGADPAGSDAGNEAVWRTEKDAKAILLKRDKERSKHYYFYTGQTWGDAKNYHIVLDSSMGEELCVDLIAKAYNGN